MMKRLFDRLFYGSGPRQSLPRGWRDTLRGSVDGYGQLQSNGLDAFHRCVHDLITKKRWEGCGGLELTREMQVAIAGNAAMMTLGFPGYSFPNLRTVLVYPGGFLIPELDGGRTLVEGQASDKGVVIVSWFGPENTARTAEVTVHEFAHLFDMLDGEADGRPPIADPAEAEIWTRDLEVEFERFVSENQEGVESILTPYAATKRSEFFAMGTERFFRHPTELRSEQPRFYELLCQLYGQDPEARIGSGQRRQGQLEVQLEDSDETRIGKLESILRDAPADTDGWEELAGLLTHREEWQPAEAALTALLELQPENTDALWERGMCRWRLDRLQEALSDLDRAIDLEPDSSAAYAARADLRLELPDRDLEAALADVESALELDPGDVTAWGVRAWIELERDDPTAARQACSQALTLAPHHPSATWCLAEIFYDEGRHTAALSQAELAIERFHISGADPPSECQLLRGFSLLQLGQHGSALEAAEQVLAADPDSAGAVKLRGEVRYELGELAEALADCTEALRRFPEYVEAFRLRAHIHRRLGRQREAADDEERARQLSWPGNGED